MDVACIFKSITEQGCVIPALGAGDTASPWAQRWVWGGCRLTQGTLSSGGCGEGAKGPQWDPRGDPRTATASLGNAALKAQPGKNSAAA